MKKPQLITLFCALILVFGLYAATQKQFFGASKNKLFQQAPISGKGLTIDSILLQAKQQLRPDQISRLNFLEHSISRGDVKDQQLHIYHQLAKFWSDSASAFEPYAWYQAEAARLENSEKSLTFAAHLFLNNLVEESHPPLKQWEALQAKDLFERSLKLNPQNDSAKIGLGSVYLYGGISSPMEGIGLIREVADRDSANVYAQWTLGQASLYSGQLDKALERFRRITLLEPRNWKAVLMMAEVQEQMGNRKEAVEWYTRLIPLIDNAAMKKEVEAKLASLKS